MDKSGSDSEVLGLKADSKDFSELRGTNLFLLHEQTGDNFRGATWIIALYIWATKKTWKKGLFFVAKRDLRESQLVVKMCLFF